jgi:hypothetical protein
MNESKPFFINPNDAGNAKLYKHIEQWVKAKFNLSEAAEITVSEIKCADAGCPDIDTYIYVKDQNEQKKYRIAKPLVYVRKWDIDGMIEVLK